MRRLFFTVDNRRMRTCAAVVVDIALWLVAFALLDRELLAEGRGFCPAVRQNRSTDPQLLGSPFLGKLSIKDYCPKSSLA